MPPSSTCKDDALKRESHAIKRGLPERIFFLVYLFSSLLHQHLITRRCSSLSRYCCRMEIGLGLPTDVHYVYHPRHKNSRTCRSQTPET